MTSEAPAPSLDALCMRLSTTEPRSTQAHAQIDSIILAGNAAETFARYSRLLTLPASDAPLVKGETAEKARALGYSLVDPTYNRLRLLTLDGKTVENDRFALGVHSLAALLAVNLGNSYRDPAEMITLKEKRAFYDRFGDALHSAAKRYHVEKDLLATLLLAESGGRAFSLSPTGALGAAQQTKWFYNPQNPLSDGKERPAINPFNTLDAIDRTADVLSLLIKRYRPIDDKKHTLALTAYHQGYPAVDKVVDEAKKVGIKDPQQIINYQQAVHPELSDSTRLESTPLLAQKHYLSKAGREYSTYVGRIRASFF